MYSRGIIVKKSKIFFASTNIYKRPFVVSVILFKVSILFHDQLYDLMVGRPGLSSRSQLTVLVYRAVMVDRTFFKVYHSFVLLFKSIFQYFFSVSYSLFHLFQRSLFYALSFDLFNLMTMKRKASKSLAASPLVNPPMTWLRCS